MGLTDYLKRFRESWKEHLTPQQFEQGVIALTECFRWMVTIDGEENQFNRSEWLCFREVFDLNEAFQHAQTEDPQAAQGGLGEGSADGPDHSDDQEHGADDPGDPKG